MEELKILNIELYALKSESVLILIEYLNEKNENCMRADKIFVQKKEALSCFERIVTKFQKEYKNIEFNIKMNI